MSLFIKMYTLFDHSECDVNNSKRFMAYILDWFLGSLCTLLPMCLMWTIWTQDVDSMTDANVLFIAGQMGNTRAYLAGIISLVCALFYYVFVPLKIYPGQTIGKRTMGFKIVKKNNNEVDLKTLLIRQVIGIIVIESCLYNASGILYSIITLVTNINILNIMKFVGIGLGLFSAFLVMKMESRRMLHDYLADTKVILFEHSDRVDERI